MFLKFSKQLPHVHLLSGFQNSVSVILMFFFIFVVLWLLRITLFWWRISNQKSPETTKGQYSKQNIVNKMNRDFKQINTHYLQRGKFEGPLYKIWDIIFNYWGSLKDQPRYVFKSILIRDNTQIGQEMLKSTLPVFLNKYYSSL